MQSPRTTFSSRRCIPLTVYVASLYDKSQRFRPHSWSLECSQRYMTICDWKSLGRRDDWHIWFRIIDRCNAKHWPSSAHMRAGVADDLDSALGLTKALIERRTRERNRRNAAVILAADWASFVYWDYWLRFLILSRLWNWFCATWYGWLYFEHDNVIVRLRVWWIFFFNDYCNYSFF